MTYLQRISVVVFVALAFPGGEVAAQEDSIKDRLDLDRRIYANTMSSAKDTFLNEFDAYMFSIAAKGDLDGYKAARADKERAKQGVELAETNPMRKKQVVFYKKIKDARSALGKAMDVAVKQYTMKLEIDKATKIQNELKSLRRIIKSDDFLSPSAPASASGLTPGQSKRLALKKSLLKREGGSEGTESAVLAALEWLYRHQDADGSWKAASFNAASVRERRGPSANRDSSRYRKDIGWKENDVAVTGLAILAFTGFDHTHRAGEYDHFVVCLKKAVKYLLSKQVLSTGDPSRDGRFGNTDSEQWIYNHVIATMAMAELLLLSNDFGLKRPVGQATKFCLRAQNDGRGWRYGIKPGDNDTSVTGWMFMALETAQQCELGMPAEAFRHSRLGALKWFDFATAPNGRTGYNVPGDEGSRLRRGHPDPFPFSKKISSMTAAALFCRLLSGQGRDSAVVRSGIKSLNLLSPAWREQRGRSLSTINMYYWYWGTYAMFQYGGRSWQEWNQKMQRALVDTQRAEYKDDSPEVDGSWDPIGEWGISGGRVYSTALCARTLEVYYRYQRQ